MNSLIVHTKRCGGFLVDPKSMNNKFYWSKVDFCLLIVFNAF